MNRMIPRMFATLGAAGLVSLGLAACGSDDKQPAQESPATDVMMDDTTSTEVMMDDTTSTEVMMESTTP